MKFGDPSQDSQGCPSGEPGRVSSIDVIYFCVLMPSFRMHPYLSQPDLLQYCKEKDILVTAYTPTGTCQIPVNANAEAHLLIGYATVRNDPTIGEIAAKYKVTPTQIILAWHLARGVVVVPASHNAEHQKENLDVRLIVTTLCTMILTPSCSCPRWVLLTSRSSPLSTRDRDFATSQTRQAVSGAGPWSSWAGRNTTRNELWDAAPCTNTIDSLSAVERSL